MSAIGSVCIPRSLPARLRHAGDLAVVRELAQADPAEAELPGDGARSAAAPGAGVPARLEARLALLLVHKRLLCHYWFSPLSWVANGSPSDRSSANACSSVLAAVVMGTPRPGVRGRGP